MTDPKHSPDEQRPWNAVVAEAAKLAADDIHDHDDPDHRQLRADLEEVHARLTGATADSRSDDA